MIIILCGPDSYRRLARKREITERFLTKHPALAVQSFQLSREHGAERLPAFLRSPSLFSTHRLAIVEDVYEAKQTIPLLKSVAQAKNTIVLINEASLPPKPFQKALGQFKIETFKTLEGAAWRTFVQKEAAATGTIFSPDALSYVCSRASGNSWLAATLLQQAAYTPSPVTAQLLRSIDYGLTQDSWELIQHIARKTGYQRVSALERALTHREDGAKLFNIIYSVLPSQAQLFARYDAAIKAGKLDYEEALVDFAIR